MNTARIDAIHLNLDAGFVQIAKKQEEFGSRLDAVLHLMNDMVQLEGQIKKMEDKIHQRLAVIEASQVNSTRLVDRIIEMSMISKGAPESAVRHRAQARLDTPTIDQLWGVDPANDVSPDEEWPPPGHDSASIVG